MIVAFHVFCMYCRNVLKKMNTSVIPSIPSLGEDEETKICFEPPVYKQRYNEVQHVLLHSYWNKHIESVVDYGCAELSFFLYLKHMNNLKHVFCVDIDVSLLETYSYKIIPFTAEYLNTSRSSPFSVSVLNGSIAAPDYKLIGVDAVIAIEVIEHLYPDELEAIPYNIFGIIHPKVAVFTTPNSDFNVLFPNPKSFRHYDHKFEWTRQQFQDWSYNIISRYADYAVRFCDIGPGPISSEHLGCCSQMAIFELKDGHCTNELLKDLTRDCVCFAQKEGDEQHESECKECACDVDFNSFGICTYQKCSKDVPKLDSPRESEEYLCSLVKYTKCHFYKLIRSAEYPFQKDDRSVEQRILDECVYNIHLRGGINGRFFKEDADRSEIPLCQLNTFNQGTFISITRLKEILQNAGWLIEDCDFYGELSPCVIYNMEDCKSSCPTDDECDFDEYHKTEFLERTNEEDPLSDWENDLSSLKNQTENVDKSDDTTTEKAKISIEVLEDHSQSSGTKEEICVASESPSVYEAKVSAEAKAKALQENAQDQHREPEMPAEHEQLHPRAPFFEANRPNQHEYREIRFFQNQNQQPVAGIVENGDLANNNRDNEGNNYQPLFANDNERRPEFADGAVEAPAAVAVMAAARLLNEVVVAANDEEDDDDSDEEDRESVLKGLSKEALFDPNSVTSLLEDTGDGGSSAGSERDEVDVDARELQVTNQSQVPFPRWLVDLLSTEDDDDDNNVAGDEDAQPPDFLCQGDGLGVHPVGEDLADDDSDSDTISQNSVEEEPQADGRASVTETVTLVDAERSDEYMEVVGRSVQQQQQQQQQSSSSAAHSAVSSVVAANNESFDEFFDTVESLNAASVAAASASPVSAAVNVDESVVACPPPSTTTS